MVEEEGVDDPEFVVVIVLVMVGDELVEADVDTEIVTVPLGLLVDVELGLFDAVYVPFEEYELDGEEVIELV